MKSIKTMILIAIATIFSALDVRAQVDDLSAKGVGITLKASTNGIGADVVYNFHPRMDVRLGYEKLHLKTDFTFTEEKVDYDATTNYNAGSLSLLFDYYLWNQLFLCAGAGWNMFRGTVDGKAGSALQYGDIEIPKEKIGTFDFQIDPSLKISPYFGIGFGRTLGLKKKVGFAFEIGGYYQGSPDLTVASTGLLSPTSNSDQQHEARLEKQVSQYSVYPVLKFSLSYKIAKF
jgi:hypothetical protein